VVRKLRQIAPDDADVLYLASKVYMNSWNGAFQRLLARAPGSYQVRLIQAEALEAQERFKEAAQEYREVIKLAPQLPGLHYRLARMIVRTAAADADQKALEALRQELEINPLDAPSLAENGEIHVRAGRLEEASRAFSEALKLQPGYVPARVGLAKVLIAKKQWSQALEHLEAAAQTAPEDEAVAYHRMLAYRGLGRAAEAKQAFETFQRLKQQTGRTPR
jgi:tetratricopeptide (TPR) repeat protein